MVLTGVSSGEGLVGAAWYDRTDGSAGLAMAPRAEGSFHGTGDLFASVLTGALVRGERLSAAAQQSADFVSRCVCRTAGQSYPRREGVDFEPLLCYLTGEKGL